MQRLVVLAAAVLLGAASPPPGAGSCSGCHGAALPINGRDAASLSGTMLAYRSGELPSTLMGRLMKPLTDSEILSIAAWVSEQRS